VPRVAEHRRFASSEADNRNDDDVDDDGSAQGGGDDALETLDAAEAAHVVGKVKQIKGALMQSHVPQLPVLLACKVARPVMPGSVHHIFVDDQAFIEALKKQGRDRVREFIRHVDPLCIPLALVRWIKHRFIIPVLPLYVHVL
jgi:hypothetical protein